MDLSSIFGGGKRGGFVVGDEVLVKPPQGHDEIMALCSRVAQSLVKRVPTEQDVYWFVVEQYDILLEQGGKAREFASNVSLLEIEHRGRRSESSYVGKPNPGVVFLEQKVMPPLVEAYGEETAQRICATIYVAFCEGFKDEVNRLRVKYATHYHNNCVSKSHFNVADEWSEVLSAVNLGIVAAVAGKENAPANIQPVAADSPAAPPKWKGNPYIMELDCGRKVTLTSLKYSRTYGSLLEGRASQHVNDSMVKQIQASKPWGERTTHFIPPVLDERDPAQPVLPCVAWHAWLTCDNSIEGNSDGSDLVVIWLSEECHDRPISEVVFSAVRGLRWDELAADFDE